MNNIYFTSDWHLSHASIMKYCNRPFSSVKEMDKTIISNFYDTIKPGANVYFLGDFSFNRVITEDFFTKLPKNIHFHFINGNHDRETKNIVEHFVDSYSPMKDIKVNGHKITLCHYPMISWNCSHWDNSTKGYYSIMLHGHHHNNVIEQKFGNFGKIINVGVDLWNFYPVSFEQIIEKAKNMPDNWNKIKR